MEIDITRFFHDAAPMDYSASIAEIGECAGRATWHAAVDDSADFMLLDTDEKREAARDFFKEFGAWTDEEIEAWSDVEVNALMLQFIASEMRTDNLTPDMDDNQWSAYEENDNLGHRIYRDTDGNVYFYIGH
jgi:hypothetical protein